MPSVLVAVPCKQSMHKKLRAIMDDNLKRLMACNPQFDLELCVYERDHSDAQHHTVTQYGKSIFDKVAAARNALVAEHLRDVHDFVLWLDADLTQVPPDLVTRLHGVTSEPERTIVAPTVFIEGTEKFYDVAAFIESGQPVYAEPPHFGNVLHDAPWFVSKEDVIPCDSVGCCYMASASLFRNGPEFASTPFTDHYPIMVKAREQGMRIVCARYVVCHHANLPKYMERWHQEEMTKWQPWMIENYVGEIRPGKRPDAGGQGGKRDQSTFRKPVKRFINR